MLNDNELYLIQVIAKSKLVRTPLLYERFYIPFEDCLNNVVQQYIEILDYINIEYPVRHNFRNSSFMIDEFCFQIAYFRYIIPTKLGSKDIMEDFLKKKLKCLNGREFSHKVFNESLSEFVIFIYMFTGIFFKSELYKKFVKIVYESEGLDNKRFEYSFVLDDKIINIEVKALECDPFLKDNIGYNHKDGDLFYKSYFKANKSSEIIPPKILREAIEIQSNYRQLNKNIKRIMEKCTNKTDNIVNIGFIMINYGTSREEFISYILNSKQGIINRIDFKKIDLLCLFSMCTITTQFMDEIYNNGHIMVFAGGLTNTKEELCKKLRLDSYVFKDIILSNEIEIISNEDWQLYRYIKRNGIITIQPNYLSEQLIEDETYKLGKNFEQVDKISNLHIITLEK